MSEVSESSEIFEKLRPFCVAVSQGPTIETLSSLLQALQHLNGKRKHVDQNLFHYLTFPLDLAIARCRYLQEKVVLQAFQCYSRLISQWVLTDRDKFVNIFGMYCKLLSSRKAASGVESIANISEEMKQAIVEGFEKLLASIDKESFASLLKPEMLPLFGHFVSLMIGMAEHERNKKLRVQSITCLKRFALLYQCVSQISENELCNCFVSFLPGISTTMTRIITGDPKQGHIVVTEAISMLTLVIALTMSHSNQTKNSLQKYSLKPGSHVEEGHTIAEEQKDISVSPNDKWTEKACQKLQLLLERLIPVLSSFNHREIKLGAICLAKTIIVDCTENMGCCLAYCVELLATFNADNDTVVASESHAILELARIKVESQDCRIISEIVEEKLIDHMTILPRIMHSSLDNKKSFILQRLIGYLILVGNKLGSILSCYHHLEKVIKAFLQILQLDVANAKIVERRQVTLSTGFGELSGEESMCIGRESQTKWKRFKCINDDKVYQQITEICKLFIKYGNIDLLFDCVIDFFRSSTIHRKQAGILINNFLLGIGALDTLEDKCFESLVDQVIMLYLSADYWTLPTCNIHTSMAIDHEEVLYELQSHSALANENRYFTEGISMEKINDNVQLLCIMLEGIAMASKVMKDDFNVYLIKVLYPLLEKAGDDNSLISQVAVSSLSIICENCGYNDIANLITCNVDYIIEAVSYNFRHLTMYSSAPNVLTAMIKHSNTEILPMISEVLDEVYFALDNYKDDIAYQLMSVLQVINQAVYKWCTREEKKEILTESTQTIYPLSKDQTDVKKFVEDLCQLHARAQGKTRDSTIPDTESLEAESVEQDEVIAEDETNSCFKDEREEVPLPYKIVITSIEKCVNFLDTNNISLKQRVLDVLYNGVQALERREKELLPLIHKVWPCVVHQLRNSKKVIVLKSIDLIRCMVLCSKDFMRHRIRKDLIPYATTFLEEQGKISAKKGSIYKFSQICKLQVKLLNFFADVISHLDIVDADLNQIFESCSIYLSCRQPQVLQQAAINFVRVVQKSDKDLAWYGLMYLSPFQDPESKWKNSMNSSAVSNNEFTANVMELVKREQYVGTILSKNVEANI